MSAVASTTIPTGTWAVDPVHTTIGFQVTDTSDLFSTVVGRFTDYEGRIEGGDEPSLAGTIRVESVSTDNDQRDAHLRSPDFLDAEKSPEIRFRSTTVEPTGEDTFHVRGAGTGKAGDERLVVDANGAFDWGTTTVQLTAAVSATKEA